jgi:5'-nucleotidase
VTRSTFDVRGSTFVVWCSSFVVRRWSFVAAALVASSLAGWWFIPAAAQQEFSARAAAPVTFLQINDVYTMVPIDGQGGLARVATLKQNLAKAGRTPFLVIAGDFLAPSVASSVFRGEHMIAALNAAGLDLATLGNHEFDFGDDVLIQRMHEATFEWVVSNVVDTKTGQPIGGAAPYLVKTFGSLKVGFIGLCLNTQEITSDKLKHTRISDPLTAAGRYLPMLKQAGATVIVAVTHLAFADDRSLVEQYPEIDLVIGGHEHYLITAAERRSFISKAGSDAKFVARIDVNQRVAGTVERFYELLPITSALADDPNTAAAIASYEAKLSTALDAVIGTTREPLDAISLHLRASETNMGNLVADAIRADARTYIAITNSGSIRGDRVAFNRIADDLRCLRRQQPGVDRLAAVVRDLSADPRRQALIVGPHGADQRLPDVAAFERTTTLIVRGDDHLRLDWCYDSAFRFFPVQPDEEFGYCLHRADLATNKVLALAGRGDVVS